MDDLTAFLNARLDEDEATAKAAELGVWQPLRARREIAAKRLILERHSPHQPAFGGLACDWCSDDVDDRPQIAKEPWPCPDVRALAAVWSDHPDYPSSSGSHAL